jgi:serine/threonine protein kinase
MSSTAPSQGQGVDLETDYDYRVTAPERLTPVTTLGRGSYGKVVLASIEENGEELLVAVKVVAKSRLKGRTHVDKSVSELNVMSQVRSRFLVRSLGAYRK